MSDPESITIRLPTPYAQNLAFLLGESDAKWASELNHYIKSEDIYPKEAMDMLDTIDEVRDQMTEQGIEWHR